MTYKILQGDVLDRLAEFPGGSFHGCLTDPPYALGEKRNMRRATPRESSRGKAAGFMGMEWDSDIPAVEVWAELLRVLKPGAMLLSFGGTRTYHRLMCNIEDAGFEIRDCMMWLFGSGWPKSRNIAKAIQEETGESAKAWSGYGTTLKPAWEPIIVAMKPTDGTFANNALKHEVAGLNVDGSRVPVSDAAYAKNCSGDRGHAQDRQRRSGFQMTCGSASDVGRWPANLILDEETAEMLDRQSGTLTSGANPTVRHSDKTRNVYGAFEGHKCKPVRGVDSGGASRFFYCAKASASERTLADGTQIDHPTMKPLELTTYLARLIIPPPGGRLVVPFSGVASEMIGAIRAGWGEVLGIELSPEYCEMAERRIRDQAPLFHAAYVAERGRTCEQP